MSIRSLFVSRDKAAEFDFESLLSPIGGKEGFLCLSETSWELAYNLVLFYGRWRSRYYYTDAVTGDQLTITDEEYSQVLDVVDLALEELQMSGCADLVAAVDNLTAQVGLINASIQVSGSQSGCCSQYGSIPPDPTTDVGDQDAGIPPSDWGDIASYNDYKCRAANKIADDIISTFDRMQTLGGVGAVIGAAGLALFLQTSLLSGILVGVMALGFSAGAAAALVIAALIGLILGNVAQFSLFADLSADLETNKDDFVCLLYTTDTPQTAETEIKGFIEQFIDVSEPFYSVVVAMLDAIVGPIITNLLFQLDEEIDEYVGDIDCAICLGPPPCPFTLNYGSGTFRYDGGEFVVSSVPRDGYHTVNFSKPCGGEGCVTGGNWCLQFVSYTFDDTSHSFSRSLWGWTGACVFNVKDYQPLTPSAPPLLTSLAVGSFEFNNAAPFTITLKIVGSSRPLVPGEDPQNHGGAC